MDEQPPPSKKPHFDVVGTNVGRSSPILDPSMTPYKDKEVTSALMVSVLAFFIC